MLELKDENIILGNKKEFAQFLGKNYSVVHATKSSFPKPNTKLNSVIEKEKNLYINWVDLPDPGSFTLKSFDIALNFIYSSTKKNTVFIYCDYAQSRSPTLLFVYLAKYTDLIPKDFFGAIDRFKEMYPQYHTPTGISQFVKKNWNELILL